MAQITRPSPPTSGPSRAYPHVDQIEDRHAQASLRLLWDRIFAVIDVVTDNTARLDGHDQSLSELSEAATTAQQTAQAAQDTALSGGGSNPPPAPTDDNGQGNIGCSQAGANGHVPAGSVISPVTVGKIVCGVGKEFPSLLLPVVDDPARQAQRTELLGRMIWHLNLAGFNSNYYPGSPQNQFVLLIDIGQIQYAYRVISYDEYPTPIQTMMVYAGQTPGGQTGTNGGIPD